MPATGVSYGPSVSGLGVTNSGSTTSSPDVEAPVAGYGLAQLVLAKYGTDAHCWIPGVGYLNGFQAANFIDSAGTQAGLVDNPVGLVRNALNLNPNELISNGTFTNSTAGWTGVAPFGGTAVLSVVNGQLELANSTTQPARAVQGITTIIGRQYSVSLIAKISTAQSASIRITNDSQGATPEIAAASTSNLSDTVLTTTFTATATTTYVALICAYVSGPAPVAYFDNISVREVTGAITATQGTTANKPILRRGAVNLLVRSQEFDSASWVKTRINAFGSGSVANATEAPDGAATADFCVEDTQTGTHNVAQSITKLATAVQYTFSVYIKAGGRNFASLRLSDSANSSSADVTVNLTNGTVGTPVTSGASPFSGASAAISAAGNGWYRVSLTATSNTDTSIFCRVYLSTTSTITENYTGNGTSGIYLWGAQLELGSTASEYIPTTTAAASSSSGNYYWQFDGSNDSLALSSVPFVATDDLCVVLAARTNEQAATARTAFGFSGAAGQRMAMIYNESGNWYLRFVDDSTNVYGVSTTPPLTAGSLRVISAKKISNASSIRLNGIQAASGTTPVGATTVTSGAIGARDAASSTPYVGSIFPVIAIKGTVSDADLLILERWVGQMSGVSI